MMLFSFFFVISEQETKSITLQNTTLDSKLWKFAEFGTDFAGCMSNLIINNKIAPLKELADAFSGTCRASKLTRFVYLLLLFAIKYSLYRFYFPVLNQDQ